MATPRYTNIGRTNIVRTDADASERQRLGEQGYYKQLQAREDERLNEEYRQAELAELQRQEEESVIRQITRAGRPSLPDLQRPVPGNIEVYGPRPFTAGEDAALEGLRAIQGAGDIARAGGGLAGLGSLGALAAAPFTGGATLPLAGSLAGLSTAGMGVGAAATALNPHSEEGQTRLSAIPEAAFAALPAVTKRVAPLVGEGFRKLDRFFRGEPLADRIAAQAKALQPTNRQILVENAGKIARMKETAGAQKAALNKDILAHNQSKLDRLRALLTGQQQLPESWQQFVVK